MSDDEHSPLDWADEEDRLAVLKHRQALAAWPTSRDMPAVVIINPR